MGVVRKSIRVMLREARERLRGRAEHERLTVRAPSPRIPDEARNSSFLKPTTTKPTEVPTNTPAKTEEPILTRTMAQLLAQQGEIGRALAIYDQLLEQNPADPSLDAEARELRSAAAKGMPDRLNPTGQDPLKNAAAVQCERKEDQLHVTWTIAQAAIDGGNTVLGDTGAVTLRVHASEPDPETGFRTRTVDTDNAGIIGEQRIDNVCPGGRYTIAIGVKKGDKFVSVAHTPPIDSPKTR